MNRNVTPYSQLKVFYHQDVIQNLLQGSRCNPVYIRIKPTNRCNHNCNYCHYRNAYLDLDEYNPLDEIPRDKMMEIIQDMEKMGVKAVTFSGGGEPLLYPHIEEAMGNVLKAGIDLSIITNGCLLKGDKAKLLAKAKWVRISVESVNDEEYCAIRGIKKGSFNELCENIRNFSKVKSDSCELGINVVVGKDNYKEIGDIACLMKELGVNHVKFAPLITVNTSEYHREIKDEITKTLEKLQDKLTTDKFKIIDLYTGDFASSVIFERQYNKCPMKEFVCAIGANSKVYFCQDKAYIHDGEVADLSEQSLAEAWYSESVNELFGNFDARKRCQQHCVHDSRNELLNSFLKMDRNHVNFI